MAGYDNQPGFFIDTAVSEAYAADLEIALQTPPHRAATLELGCGSGAFTQWLDARHMQITGVDRSEAQLIEARQRLPHIDFKQCDIESSTEVDAITAAHGQFDLLISRYVIHELADPIETFASWRKLLKPTGKLLLIENAWIRNNWGSSDWGKRSDDLPLACTQTWATAAYCLKKAGYMVTHTRWMETANELHATRLVIGFRLYCIVAEYPLSLHTEIS
jgi:SAM-dependent methyltransferase